MGGGVVLTVSLPRPITLKWRRPFSTFDVRVPELLLLLLLLPSSSPVRRHFSCRLSPSHTHTHTNTHTTHYTGMSECLRVPCLKGSQKLVTEPVRKRRDPPPR